MGEVEAAVGIARNAEALGIIGFLVLGLIVCGVAIRHLNAKLDEERKGREAERKSHAAELQALNDKRIEDVERALDVMGTFNEGRKAIAQTLEQLSGAIEKIAETQVAIGERIIELKFSDRTRRT